jgi:OPA family glycerol-3-phosphate transporter-like MFS transporter
MSTGVFAVFALVAAAGVAHSRAVFSGLWRWFAPAPATPCRPAAEVARLYPRYRWQVFEAAFVGYAAFYLVRNNFAPVAKEIGAALQYDKLMIGDLLAGTALAYGLGKFVMGCLADRCDARKYIAVGMLLTAALNFLFGATANYWAHLLLWTLNGFIQGMGYGPCTRGLSHWYSVKERGAVFGAWNIAHNLGGGLAGYLAAKCAEHWGWPSAFFVPGIIATLCAGYLFWRMRDTPQSLGLPALEQYRHEATSAATRNGERELTTRELLRTYILPNRMLWLVALANIFVYIARYSMVDWGPTYLKEVKGASLGEGGFSTLVIEFAGAAGMLTMGWLSDRWGGRRGRVSVLALVPALLAFAGVCVVPAGMLWLDLTLFGVIGFFVYTPVLFSGVMALDLTSKKAVGAASGFVGFFGYVGRVLQGKGLGWLAQDYGWNVALYATLAATFLALALLGLTWNVRPRVSGSSGNTGG